MTAGNRLRAGVLVLAFSLILCSPRPALCLYGKKDAGKEDVEAKPTRVKLHDLALLDQDGRKHRFASEVIGDRIVVIDTIFTTCGLICPILSSIFMDLQDELGGLLGKEVVLVSISVDPVTDIPPRLKEYAQKWKAGPGWLFLTGEKQTVDRVLDGLGLYAADFTAHPSMILVGDGRSGTWTRFYGFASPGQLKEKIQEMRARSRKGAPKEKARP
jgi:protein SCO1/2